MDRGQLRVASGLLAKAQSTDSDAEAAALAEKAYVLLAKFLNAYEEDQLRTTGRPRRRERRLLRDRRADRRNNRSGDRAGGRAVDGQSGRPGERAPGEPAAAPGAGADAARAYRRLNESPRRRGDGQIDVTA
ncbi:MAG TPA: hypothetical protein VGG23_03465 [Acidimicrobiales bacterium]